MPSSIVYFCCYCGLSFVAIARAGTEQRGLRVKEEEAGEYMVCGCVCLYAQLYVGGKEMRGCSKAGVWVCQREMAQGRGCCNWVLPHEYCRCIISLSLKMGVG